jgi:hypothetical protein
VENIAVLASLLGCRISSLPMKYLGLPLGASYKATSIWNGVIETMERRLAGWKKIYLSKGGRLTLIKSTLSNLPTYYMSLFPLPVGVANRLERLQRDFLWGGIGDEFKFHLVNWERICRSIKSGGLGVRNLLQFNRALLGKWLWRYAMDREALWRLVVDAKYNSSRGGWCSEEVVGSFGVGVWKHIRRGWDKFSTFAHFDVGIGSKVSFWHDIWCGDRPLKISYPTLFSIAQQQDAWVADHMQNQDGRTQWDVIFTRPVQDWEVEMVLSFFEQLYSIQFRQGEDDRMTWSLSKRGLFDVKSFYTRLISQDCLPFPWKSIWRVKAPARVAFFVWTAALGKILTMDNLRKRILWWWSGVVCVRRVGNPLIIYCFIVKLRVTFGVLFIICLELFGLCQDG